MSKKNIVKTDILSEADMLVHGDRAGAYGSALENAEAWANLFSAATGIHVRAIHYPISQICVKLARERSRTKYDNWRDIAGYVGVWGKIQKELNQLEQEEEEPEWPDEPESIENLRVTGND